MSTEYKYTKEVNATKLTKEIAADPNILHALDYITKAGIQVSIWMKDVLGPAEETALTVLVGNHVADTDDEEAPILVKIQEEYSDTNATGGSFQTVTLGVDVGDEVGAWYTADHSFPFPIAMVSCDLLISEQHVGDILEVIAMPNTPIGAIIEDVTTGDKELKVQQSVLDNAKVGHYIDITDGTNLSDMGRIVTKTSTSIIMENAATHDFEMASPTYVRLSVKIFDNWEFCGAGRIDIGDSKVGTSSLPANATLRMKYKNVTGGTKRFVAPMDIMY